MQTSLPVLGVSKLHNSSSYYLISHKGNTCIIHKHLFQPFGDPGIQSSKKKDDNIHTFCPVFKGKVGRMAENPI